MYPSNLIQYSRRNKNIKNTKSFGDKFKHPKKYDNIELYTVMVTFIVYII